jgi:mannose-1-phosphate guanylyltransferase
MLKLFGERTLFQISLERLKPLFPLERIFVVTSPEMAQEFQQRVPELPAVNYILEPGPRDTAAAIGLAAVTLRKRDPEAVMAVVTADHFIENEDRFLQVLQAARQVAEQGFLVTLGILPSYPATGFGYIQQGDYLGTYENIVVFRALSFKEKPDLATAIQFLEKEDHSWNSGMFIWRVERVLEEIKRQMPALDKVLKEIEAAWGREDFNHILRQVWEDLERISIDFGVMEGAKEVAVIPAKGLGWNDVGSWDTLFDVLEPDEDGNLLLSEDHLNLNCRNTLVRQNGQYRRLVVTLGLQDMVIVDTDDVLLVCTREQAQDVKEVVLRLKSEGKDQYL